MLVTKLKNSKWLVGVISILVIGMISTWIYSSYNRIGEQAKSQQVNVFESQYFYNRLVEATEVLYYDKLINNDEPLYSLKTNDVDFLYQQYNQYYFDDQGFYNNSEVGNISFEAMTQEEKQEVVNECVRLAALSYIENARQSFNNLKNLEYFAINHRTNEKVSNGSFTFSETMSLTASEIEKLKENYQYFILLNYDSNGNLTVSDLYDAKITSSQLSNYDLNLKTDAIKMAHRMLAERIDEEVGYELTPIKDMSYLYAIPKNFVYNDYISQMANNYEWWSIGSVVGNYSWIAVALVAITAIILPVNSFKNSKLLKWLFKLPLEIVTILSCCLIPIFIEGMPSIVKHTLEGDLLSESFYLMFPANIHKYIDPTINMILWMALLACIFMVCLYVKNLFKTGVKGKFITINGLRWCWRKAKAAYRNLTNIDLKNANTKKLALFMVIQFIIISILCLTWFIGPFIAIVYVGFLFFYLNKKLKKVESDYSKLFVVTNELAEGNLDVQVDEDLGMFNSFKEEVVNIQSGFKKAVQNEVKSQRMKTDLIANVSHDLKTPLTSIITYVDLLKDENLNQEKRVQYLETLDQKSQRLKVLIEDLFEMSKASSGNISMNLQVVDVVSLMKQTLLETEDKIEASGLVIRRQFPEHKVMLSLDSERTFRVFENLISNMSKYAMAGTRAYIDIVDNEDIVQIMFRNMSADEITVNVDELLERFVRGDQSRHTEGSGLGLAIAKSFVELQGGNFEVLIDGDLFKVIISFNK